MVTLPLPRRTTPDHSFRACSTSTHEPDLALHNRFPHRFASRLEDQSPSSSLSETTSDSPPPRSMRLKEHNPKTTIRVILQDSFTPLQSLLHWQPGLGLANRDASKEEERQSQPASCDESAE